MSGTREAVKEPVKRSDVDDEYLAPGDVARLLCVSARTVSRWADQGRIPHVVTVGGHRRFRRSDVLELLATQARQAGGDRMA